MDPSVARWLNNFWHDVVTPDIGRALQQMSLQKAVKLLVSEFKQEFMRDRTLTKEDRTVIKAFRIAATNFVETGLATGKWKSPRLTSSGKEKSAPPPFPRGRKTKKKAHKDIPVFTRRVTRSMSRGGLA